MKSTNLKLYGCRLLDSRGATAEPAADDWWPSMYYVQVQGQLHILNKSACDFAQWTTKDLAIVRVVQDNTWTSNLNKLLDFYMQE